MNLNRVLQTRQDGGHVYRIAVHQSERRKIGIADRMYRLRTIVLTHHTHRIGVCLAAETAGKVQQPVQCLVWLQLIVHRTLHLAVYASQSTVRVHYHHIAVLQTHIAVQHTVHQVAVQVYLTQQLVLTEHANLTQRTLIRYAACHIQRVQHVGKRGQLIRPGQHYLTHHVHRYRTALTQAQHDLAALVTLAYGVLQPARGLDDRQPAKRYRTITVYRHRTVRTDRTAHIQLTRTIDVDDHFVTRTQCVVLRRCLIHVRLKLCIRRAEYILPEHFQLLLLFRHRLAEHLLHQLQCLIIRGGSGLSIVLTLAARLRTAYAGLLSTRLLKHIHLTAHTLQLFQTRTVAQQLLGYLLLAFALLIERQSRLNNLLISDCHRTHHRHQ